jgi:glycosyltransferase involved in cell wall biosynthesis
VVEAAVRRFHVCNTRSRSGIARYAEAFQRVALGPLGYEFLQPDEVPAAAAATEGGRAATWHLQMGGAQQAERDAYVRLVDAGCTRVDLTLHEPPFLSFPFFRFRHHRLNTLSRGFDWYLDSLGIQRRYLRQARRIFVLSRRGAAVLRERQGIDGAVVIPMVVDPSTIWCAGPDDAARDILFFGFIGRSKGLGYALDLHARILESRPGLRMHVIGEALSARDRRELEELLAAHPVAVEYHGFVAEAALDGIFARCAHLFAPFAPYKYFTPASSTVVNGLRRGRIVWASDVNAIRESIVPGVNGMLFSGSLDQDATAFCALEEDGMRRAAMAQAALETARAAATYDYASHFREDD